MFSHSKEYEMQPENVMSVVSVNVGLPRKMVWEGKTVLTSIFPELLQIATDKKISVIIFPMSAGGLAQLLFIRQH